MSKYLFDEEELSKELITLLAIVKSSRSSHKFLNPIANNKKLLPIFVIEWKIIQNNLIATAIKLRIIDDQFKQHSIQPNFHFINVGKFTQGCTQKDLSLRESCNKIIHAIKFSPKTSPKLKQECDQYYTKKIVLKGKHDSQEWQVEIDIEKYICDGLVLIKQYDENWDISSR